MYCKHCGKEIEDNSSFCNHCGKPLNGDQKALNNKFVWIIYLMWALANLYLLMGEKYYNCSSYFFPFTSNDEVYNWSKDYYDFSEYVIYVFVFPAILYVIYSRNKKRIDKFVFNVLNKE